MYFRCLHRDQGANIERPLIAEDTPLRAAGVFRRPRAIEGGEAPEPRAIR